MTPRTRAIVIFVAKLMFSALLLAFLFTRLDTGAITAILRTVSVPLLALGAVWMIAMSALSAVKWSLLLREQGLAVPYPVLLRTYLISNFVNLFMPSIVGGDAYRAARLRGYTAGIRNALPSIVVERGTGVAALLVIGTVGLGHLLYPDALRIIVASLLVATVLGYLLLIGPVRTALGRLDPGRWRGTTGVLVQIIEAMRPSLRFGAVVVLSFAFHLGVVVTSIIYSAATAITVDFSQLLVAVPVVYLVEILPVSISGIGVREGTFAAMFGLLGLMPEHGLILGLTITVMRYVSFGILGGLLFAWDSHARDGSSPSVDAARQDADHSG